jgi:hypothetical protein
MLVFNAASVVTSNPFRVSDKQFLSRNREMLGDMRDGGREVIVPALAR